MILLGPLHQLTKRKLLLVSLTEVLIIILLLVNPLGSGLFIKFLIGKWINSTSDAAMLFFLSFTLIILFNYRFFAFKKENYFLPFIVVLTLSYLSHLAMVITYFRHFQIPFNEHVYHWFYDKNSFTSLMHSHQGKNALLILNKFFNIPYKKYDIGLPFFSSTNLFVLAVFTFSLLLSFIFALRYVQTAIYLLKNDYAKIIAILLSCTLLLKNIVDGGLLSYTTFPALLVICSQYFRSIKLFIVGAILQIVLYFLILGINQIYFLSNLIFLDCSFVLLLTLKESFHCHVIAKGLLVSYLLLNVWIETKLNLLPLYKTIDKKHFQVIYCNPMCHEQYNFISKPLYLVYRQFDEDVFKVRKTIIIHRYKRESNQYYKLRFRILNVNGWEGKIRSSQQFIIQSSQIDPNKFITLIIKNKAPINQIYNLNEEEVLYKNNYYVFLHQLNYFLQQNGVNEYIMLGSQ